MLEVFKKYQVVLTPVGVVVAILLVRLAMAPYVREYVPMLFFLFAPVIAGLVSGTVAGLVAAGLALVVGRFFFMEPVYSLIVPATPDAYRLAMFALQGVAGSTLCGALRASRERLQGALSRQGRQHALTLLSEERYKALIAATTDAIWTAGVDCRFVQRTPAWQEFTGQSWEQYRDLGWLNAFHPDDRQPVSSTLSKALLAGGVLEVDGRLWRADLNAYRHCELRAVTLPSEAGLVREWVGSVTDVHETRAAAVELFAAKEAAEAASKAKNQFLANMSHEMRTPLGAIAGFSELMLESVGSGPGLEHALVIRRNAARLNRIVDDVLDVARIESERVEIIHGAFELNALIDEAVQGLRTMAESKSLYFRVVKAFPGPVSVCTDSERLRQILGNVIGNAIKFTERGGVTIEVSVFPRRNSVGLEGAPVVGTRQADGEALPLPELIMTPDSHSVGSQDTGGEDVDLVMTIDDTGVGMAVENHQRIFLPFEQADNGLARKFGGIGLGLYLSRRMARLLGGDLELLHSRPGGGSSFRISLPVNVQAITVQGLGSSVRDSNGSMGAGPAQPGDGLIRVLLIEDSADNQLLVKALLAKEPVSVDTADNGEEGVRAALSKGPYDVVLMDIQMPVMDGMEATRRLRLSGYDRPIIAMTAHAMAGDRERYLEMGCDDYVSKPINLSELRGKIRLHGRDVGNMRLPENPGQEPRGRV